MERRSESRGRLSRRALALAATAGSMAIFARNDSPPHTRHELLPRETRYVFPANYQAAHIGRHVLKYEQGMRWRPNLPPKSPATLPATVRPAAVSTRTNAANTQIATTQPYTYGVTPEQYAEWSKVNICEEGGNWHVIGPVYSGGLGISDANWIAYGGLRFAPNAAYATRYQQIVIAENIQPNPPDQYGCQPGGW